MKAEESYILVAIKSIHSLIWVVFVWMITYILWSGISGNITLYSWLAAAAVICESLVLLIFKGSCPLTKIARKYSDSPKSNFDIYLPEWLAKYNKQIFGTLFCIGLLLIANTGQTDHLIPEQIDHRLVWRRF